MSGKYKDLMILRSDFLIVGGGVIGLSSALELARAGAQVTVVERGRCGVESSWAGGGILSPLLPWNYPQAVTDLTGLSCRLFPEWVKQIGQASGIDPEYRACGLLVLPDFDDSPALDWGRRHQLRVETASGRVIAPGLRADETALWLPEVAQVRNPRLMKALRRTLELAGVKVVEQAEATRLVTGQGRVARLETSAGDFGAENYVVAAGAWSKRLLGEFGWQIDIEPVRGQMLLFKANPGLLQQIILRNGTYLIPRADGHILVGSTLEQVGFDKSTTGAAKEGLYRLAVDILPALARAELVMHWAGLRPGSPGNIPIIDRHSQLENLYLNSGHFRYGVTMAPASAQILVNRILGKPQAIGVSAYDWPAG